MKNIFTILLLITSTSIYSQSFRASRNVISTSLYQPFTTVGGYTLSFERTLDPGYSLTAAQFSYKLNVTSLYNNRRARLDGPQRFYDSDAYQYSGFAIMPEIRYYFAWDAPVGVYMNLFGSYADYSRIYTDVRVGNAANNETRYSEIGRGIGAGYQFKIFDDFTLDIVLGYNRLVLNSETKNYGSDEFIENPKENDEKFYVNLHFGVNF